MNRDALLEAHRRLEGLHGLQGFLLRELQQPEQMVVVQVGLAFGLEPDGEEEVLPWHLAPKDGREPTRRESVAVAAVALAVAIAVGLEHPLRALAEVDGPRTSSRAGDVEPDPHADLGGEVRTHRQ